MNYPDLIWHLIELVLEKETHTTQNTNEINEGNQLNANTHDETI